MRSIRCDILPVFCDIFQFNLAYERKPVAILGRVWLVPLRYEIGNQTKKRLTISAASDIILTA